MQHNDFKTKVLGIKLLTPTVFELSLQKPDDLKDYISGQFMSFLIPNSGPQGRPLRRAYSIASHSSEADLKFWIKNVHGPGTTYLSQLKSGHEVHLFGPYGDFILNENSSRKVIFLATGTGIAPFRSMILNPKNEGLFQESELWFGVRTEDEILGEDLLKMKVNFRAAVSQGQNQNSSRHGGRITDFLDHHLKNKNPNDWDYYLCGNGAMIQEVRKTLSEIGVAKEQVHFEKYY